MVEIFSTARVNIIVFLDSSASLGMTRKNVTLNGVKGLKIEIPHFVSE